MSRTSSSRSTSDASDGVPMPDEAGRDLRVEQLRRARAARALEDREVLLGGVGDHACPGRRGSRRAARCRRSSGSTERDAAGPRDLHQREARPVGALAVELGVERVAGLVARAASIRLGELRRRRRSSGVPWPQHDAVRPRSARSGRRRGQAAGSDAATAARTAPSRSNDAQHLALVVGEVADDHVGAARRAEVGERVGDPVRRRRRPARPGRSRGSRGRGSGRRPRPASASSAPTCTSRRTAIVAGVAAVARARLAVGLDERAHLGRASPRAR